jgi:hypothetical protein
MAGSRLLHQCLSTIMDKAFRGFPGSDPPACGRLPVTVVWHDRPHLSRSRCDASLGSAGLLLCLFRPDQAPFSSLRSPCRHPRASRVWLTRTPRGLWIHFGVLSSHSVGSKIRSPSSGPSSTLSGTFCAVCREAPFRRLASSTPMRLHFSACSEL